MRIHDKLLGLIILAIGLGVVVHASSFPALPDGNLGPGLFPIILGSLFAVSGLVLSINGFRKGDGKPLFENASQLTLPGFLNIAAVIALILFYVLASEYLGFIITMFVVLLALMMLLKTRIVLAVIVSAAATIIIYLIFYKGLLVPLPEGLLAF